MRLSETGGSLFGLSLTAFGVLQFIYGDFIPGRAPAWPQGLPGQTAWAFLTGAVFIVSGLLMIAGRNPRSAGGIAGFLILIWALMRQIPGLLGDLGGAAITFAGKALTMVSGSFAVASADEDRARAAPLNALGRASLGLFMVVSGIQHFIYSRFVAQLVPTWIPGSMFWTYFAGVALIAGGLGMQLRATRWLAGLLSGAMILSWVFMLHLPRAINAAEGNRQNEWTAVFEALAFAGLSFFYTGAAAPRDS